MGISREDMFAIEPPSGPRPSAPPGPPPTLRETSTPGGGPGHDPRLTPVPDRSNKLKLAAIGGGVASAGLIVLAVLLHGQKSDAEERAEVMAAKNRDLADALELHRAGAIDLGGKLETCTKELTEGKTVIEARTTKVEALESQLAHTRSAVATLEQKEAEFKAVTRQFQKMIDSGKLDVVFRRGQMIVKLPARILFASGSADVSEGGKKALAEVAAILRPMRRKFTVAGHTDNVPISKPFKSNWELSAARAVSVVDVLIGAGVPGRRLVAAGFGPYAPIANNRSARGRQTNRRIEIILEPELSPAMRAVAKKLAKRSKRAKRNKRNKTASKSNPRKR